MIRFTTKFGGLETSVEFDDFQEAMLFFFATEATPEQETRIKKTMNSIYGAEGPEPAVSRVDVKRE